MHRGKHGRCPLRRTAIGMRIALPEGSVDIFNLAKKGGTGVEQLERLYARNLPLSKTMARTPHASDEELTYINVANRPQVNLFDLQFDTRQVCIESAI